MHLNLHLHLAATGAGWETQESWRHATSRACRCFSPLPAPVEWPLKADCKECPGLPGLLAPLRLPGTPCTSRTVLLCVFSETVLYFMVHLPRRCASISYDEWGLIARQYTS